MTSNSEVLISVVVPVWNADRYLREALESLRSQTYANFEAILVDDGSTDNSPEICKEFCKSDSRFHLIIQENAGVSAARNAGLDLSKGEWIAFMDADDIIMSDALELLIQSANECGAGIIVGEYTQNNDTQKSNCQNAKMSKCHIDKITKTIDSDEAILIGLYQKKILNNPWGVLFHRSVFNGARPLRFRKCRYEDLDIFYQAFERVAKICIIDRVVYYYRNNPESFINTWSDSRLDVLDVTDRMVTHFKDRSAALFRAAQDRRFSAHFNMLLMMRKFGIDNTEQKERCRRVIRQLRKAELADRNVRLKNKLGALLSYLIL